MRQRWRAAFQTFIALVLAGLVACASGPKAPPSQASPAQRVVAAAPRPAAEQSETPLLVPQVITLRGPVRLSAVSGVCYIVRGEGGMLAQQGVTLQDADVLDLGNAGENGSVTLHSGAKSDIVLRRASGRFFKLQIRP
jgi:hypothetical protein